MTGPALEPTQPGEGLAVRRITRPDARWLQRLHELDSEAFGGLGLRTCDLAVMAEAGMVLVGEVGDEIVGGCQMVRMVDEPGFLFVVGFYVRAGRQRRGWGTALLSAAIQEAQKAGADGLMLTVAPDNVGALGLYQKAGFAVEESLDDFYGVGKHRHLLRLRFEQGGLRGSV